VNPGAERLLDKAGRALAAAERLVDAGDTEFAVGRAYYAMFYVATAVLDERGLQFRKHSGVSSAFGQHLVKTGEWDQKYHRWLPEAFSLRIVGDYEVLAEFSENDVRTVIERAREFLEEARWRLTADE